MKSEKKLSECFDGVSVRGLPSLTIPPEVDHIDYPLLDERFKEGLAKIAQAVMERAGSPRIVTVAGTSRELNATNAEVIIGTVIEEANKGQIDLTGFESFWTFAKQDIIAKLGAFEKDFDLVVDNCEPVDAGYHCTTCVCSYRNGVIEEALAEADLLLELAKSQGLSLYGVDLGPQISEFREKTLEPWETKNICNGDSKAKRGGSSGICDITEMSAVRFGRSKSTETTCSLLFICGKSEISGSMEMITDGLYIAKGSEFANTEIGKSADGKDGSNPGENGENGAAGRPAPNLSITAEYSLRASAGSLLYRSKGGSGGNGGNGMEGEDKVGQIPWAPSDAKEVVENGEQYNYEKHCEKHCGHHCETCDEHWYFKFELIFDACGGKGGNGGDGGAGGPAGLLQILGNSGITADNIQLESTGGAAGTAAAGAYGVNVIRTYTGWHRYWESAGCHGIGGLFCGPSYHHAWDGYSRTPDIDPDCPGQAGTPGKPGQNWKP